MIKIGDKYTHELTYKQTDVNTFAQITGDNNPIHLDAEFAAKTPFKRPIVHGFYSASVFSMVFGTKFPGEGTIYMYQDMKFLAPVFVEELYKAKFEVMEVNTEKHVGVIKCILEDSSGKIVIEGTAKLKNNAQFV
ncbi:(R)-specific enoyl-CoA hydratase [bioreactor metagenome]|uniref:(R)-specific enoyl-CoA hydratase n=1 Tax=bioreactor metagenome TaxID=1076179 RepID=A0A645D9T3_9ZZZZ